MMNTPWTNIRCSQHGTVLNANYNSQNVHDWSRPFTTDHSGPRLITRVHAHSRWCNLVFDYCPIRTIIVHRSQNGELSALWDWQSWESREGLKAVACFRFHRRPSFSMDWPPLSAVGNQQVANLHDPVPSFNRWQMICWILPPWSFPVVLPSTPCRNRYSQCALRAALQEICELQIRMGGDYIFPSVPARRSKHGPPSSSVQGPWELESAAAQWR